MREYADNTRYEAVAYINADAGAEVVAEKRGRYVIRTTGAGASITHVDNCVLG